ncbi:MAG: lactate/malate family dehydrogenase [Oscillospiraceae bacterium]
MTKKRIVGVIGLGHVGAHVAYALAVQGIADELILVDQKEQKLASEVQDLRDAAAYLPHRVTVRAGDFADLGECDVIVNSVGKIELLETHDRLTEMDFTIPAGGAMPTRSRRAALTACSSTSPTPATS